MNNDNQINKNNMQNQTGHNDFLLDEQKKISKLSNNSNDMSNSSNWQFEYAKEKEISHPQNIQSKPINKISANNFNKKQNKPLSHVQNNNPSNKNFELDRILNDFIPRIDEEEEDTSSISFFTKKKIKYAGAIFSCIAVIVIVVISLYINNGSKDNTINNSKNNKNIVQNHTATLSNTPLLSEEPAATEEVSASPSISPSNTAESSPTVQESEEVSKEATVSPQSTAKETSSSKKTAPASTAKATATSATKTPVVTPSSTASLLAAGMSSQGEGQDGWTINYYNGGYSTSSFNNNVYTIDILDQGTVDWSVQMFQQGLDFKKGVDYIVSYTIKSNCARSITTTIEETHDDWTAFVDKTFDIPENQAVKITFHTGKITGDPDKFYIGLGLVDGARRLSPHTIDICNLSITPVTNRVGG